MGPEEENSSRRDQPTENFENTGPTQNTHGRHVSLERKDLLCRPKHAQALPLNVSQFLDIGIVGDQVV